MLTHARVLPPQLLLLLRRDRRRAGSQILVRTHTPPPGSHLSVSTSLSLIGNGRASTQRASFSVKINIARTERRRCWGCRAGRTRSSSRGRAPTTRRRCRAARTAAAGGRRTCRASAEPTAPTAVGRGRRASTTTTTARTLATGAGVGWRGARAARRGCCRTRATGKRRWSFSTESRTGFSTARYATTTYRDCTWTFWTDSW